MNVRRHFIAALLVVLVGQADRAEAKWPHGSHHVAPTVLNGTAGRGSWAGVPGMGAPLPQNKAAHNPVIGSVSRTGLFAHPGTGRTRYTGTVYDSTTGRFGKSSFRQ